MTRKNAFPFRQRYIKLKKYKRNKLALLSKNTFAIWEYGRNVLYNFFNHINNLISSIKFTLESESNNSLMFSLVSSMGASVLPHTVSLFIVRCVVQRFLSLIHI